jgi:hypothetical protein
MIDGKPTTPQARQHQEAEAARQPSLQGQTARERHETIATLARFIAASAS